MDKYKRLLLNAGLAALGVFVVGISAFEKAPGIAALSALGWGAFRVAAGVIAAGLGKPVPVDTPPPPDPTE